jgi:hypothetical protein
MESIASTGARKISNWLVAGVELISGEHIVNILALSKLCLLINKSTDLPLEKYVSSLLKNNGHINYAGNSLFTALLANSLILVRGDSDQVAGAKEYLSILEEVGDINFNELNKTMLNLVFANGQSDITNEINIDIPSFETDISKMITHVLDQIEVKTKFGLNAVNCDMVFVSRIEGMIIYSMQVYDIPLAMRCLRARNYLGAAQSFAIETGLDFIRHQFCSDGSFGDFQTALAEIEDTSRKRSICFEIKLSVAIQVLWTLYELDHPDNNLFRQFAESQKYCTA